MAGDSSQWVDQNVHQNEQEVTCSLDMYNLFYTEVGVNDPADVVNEACLRLEAMGVTTAQRLREAPEELIHLALP